MPRSAHIGRITLTVISVIGNLVKLRFGTLDGLSSVGKSLNSWQCAGMILLDGCMLMTTTAFFWPRGCFVLAFLTCSSVSVVVGFVRIELLFAYIWMALSMRTFWSIGGKSLGHGTTNAIGWAVPS